MVLFLTSSPTGPLDNSRIVDGLDPKNGLIEELKKRWPECPKCLLITARPADPAFNDRIQNDMRHVLRRGGLPFACVDLWDDRTEDTSAQALCAYDVVFLGGGHLPTQNAFFQRIGLRESMKQFQGIVLGISAGTMNCADVVYAQPEEPGESVDPNYRRFLPGLALTTRNVLPHYQMVKDYILDGKRLYEDITYADSMGREFFALVDGSYILCEHGTEVIYGEAYRLANGQFQQICSEDRILLLPDP